MPQCERSPLEKLEFDAMLPNVNILYLSCRVLILLDLSYVSRFWTQFEAFLAMRTVSATGLGSLPDLTAAAASSPLACRYTIVPLHNATMALAEQLVLMWAKKTPEEAHAVLSQPDVTVTNQRDSTAGHRLERLTSSNSRAAS